MFSEKKDKNTVNPGTGQNRINEGTSLQGDIISKGFFRIDGSIKGNVNTPSKVVIGKTGVIVGTLTCQNADIEGTFKGDLDVAETLTLRSTALIDGEVSTGKLAVEPGATFNASCIMKGSKKAELKDELFSEKENKEKIKLQNHPFDRSQRIQKSKAEQGQ